MKKNKIYYLCLSAMLIAVAIIIPTFSPIKITIEPMSFTLASHVAIIIAMFISPSVAIAVELGATLGFFLGGFPLVIVLRALSQIVFVVIGALWLKKKPNTMKKASSMIIYCVIIGIIHGICEIIVCLPFYSTSSLTQLIYPIFILVGIGTLVHSCVDFTIATVLWKALLRSPAIKKVALVDEIL